MINVNNIPLHPHSSDLSDSSESFDDSFSHKSNENKSKDKEESPDCNVNKDKSSSQNDISIHNSFAINNKKEEVIGNSFISYIPQCSSPEEKNDENEDIMTILKNLEDFGKEYEKNDFGNEIKVKTYFTSKNLEFKEESFKDSKKKENDKTFLKKKRKYK